MLSGLVRDYFLAYARSGIFTQTAYLSLVLAAKEVLLCNFEIDFDISLKRGLIL